MHKEIKYILWDFDGVLINSDAVREEGFASTLRDYPQEEVDALLAFHRANGGWSRYVKFRYFFETIRKEPVSEERIADLATSFSEIMQRKLTDKALLIPETLTFLQNNASKLPMHIVSGSDQTELRHLCQQLGIDSYFVSIHGSPTPKTQLIADVLKHYNYHPKDGLMIGDAINDFEAAAANNVPFLGYGNSIVEAKTNANFEGLKEILLVGNNFRII